MRILFLPVVLFPAVVYYFGGFAWMLATLTAMFLCAALVLFVASLNTYITEELEDYEQ